MLKEWNGTEKPQEEEISARLTAARNRLMQQQMQVKEQKLPVLVLVEGWGTAGKGFVIGQIIRNIDPRFFKVASMEEPTVEEQRKPFLCRHFTRIPEAGKFQFLDSGWMDEVIKGKLYDGMTDAEYAMRVESIKRFERQLTDNGYLVMKFFLHISRKEQKKRIESLLESKDTRWRVGKHDQWQNTHYGKCEDAFDSYLKETNMPSAPWYIIDARSRKWAETQVLEMLTQGIEIALGNRAMAVPLLQNVFPLTQMPQLSQIALDGTIEAEEYKAEADKGMEEDAKEAREKATLQSEEAVRKRREEREKFEEKIEENREADTLEVSEEGKVLLKSNTDSNCSDAPKSHSDSAQESVIYTKTGEASRKEQTSSISVSV